LNGTTKTRKGYAKWEVGRRKWEGVAQSTHRSRKINVATDIDLLAGGFFLSVLLFVLESLAIIGFESAGFFARFARLP